MLGKPPIVKVRKKILLIDHSARVTRSIREALEKSGKYSIREERDTMFAIHAARWFLPDLIMVDLTSTLSDGRMIAQELQNDKELSATPLLCLSRFVSEREFFSAGILSGYTFLASPVPMEHLLRAVDCLLWR